MQRLNITNLMSGGLITNYYCSSRCRHCLYRCSPKWPKDFITGKTARLNIQVMKKLNCFSMHIGGGEPLLNPDGVLQVLSAANDLGMHVEYVETNSSWFKNHNSACEIIRELAHNGLSTLLISISPFHNEHIPFYKVKGVMKACRDEGVSVFPWISEFFPEIDVLPNRKKHPPEEYLEHYGENYTKSILDRYWVSAGGRALDLLAENSTQIPLREIVDKSRRGCKELINTSHFHFDLYGNYVPGLCAGLSVRREDMGEPLSETEYPLLTLLFNKGIGGLLDYARETYHFKESKTTYANKCELCAEIRFFLVNQIGLDSIELQPKRHYGNL